MQKKLYVHLGMNGFTWFKNFKSLHQMNYYEDSEESSFKTNIEAIIKFLIYADGNDGYKEDIYVYLYIDRIVFDKLSDEIPDLYEDDEGILYMYNFPVAIIVS